MNKEILAKLVDALLVELGAAAERGDVKVTVYPSLKSAVIDVRCPDGATAAAFGVLGHVKKTE